MLKSFLSEYIYCFVLLLLPSALGGYKEEHEGFVKNFKGTSAFFIIICLAHLPASILLLKIVQGSSKPLFIRDLFCLVLPLLLNMTILADYCYITLFFMVTCEMLYIFRFNPYRARKPSDNELLENGNQREKSSFSSAVVRCQKAAYLNLFKGKISSHYSSYNLSFTDKYSLDRYNSFFKYVIDFISLFLWDFSILMFLTILRIFFVFLPPPTFIFYVHILYLYWSYDCCYCSKYN